MSQSPTDYLVAKLRALVAQWRAAADAAVPEAYRSRGLERKYLNGDNDAAGTNDCAEVLEDLLDEHLTPADQSRAKK